MAKEKTTKVNEVVDNNRIDFYELAISTSRSSNAVIDALAKRGAFAGEELFTVGQLREQSLKTIADGEAYLQTLVPNED